MSKGKGNSAQTRRDDTFCVIKIKPVSSHKSTIEVVLDTPKRFHRIKKRERFAMLRSKVLKMNLVVDDVNALLPSLYDYRVLSTMRQNFQQWRPLSSLDQKDGVAMAMMLMDNTDGLRNVKERREKSRRKRFENFFEKFHAMGTLRSEHPWFETMIEAVIVEKNGGGKGWGVIKNVVNKERFDRLFLLEKGDGDTLGVKFLQQLWLAATEDGAFDGWVNKHLALVEFSKEVSKER